MENILKILWVGFVSVLYLPAHSASFSLAPYASINSTKSVLSNSDGSETDKRQQRITYGIRANITFFSIMRFQLGVGQSETKDTFKNQNVTDEFGKIDLKKELNISTDDPDNEVEITETQRKGRVSLILDPSFSIFVLRARVGVQATQRLFKKVATGETEEDFEGPIEFAPTAGGGFGIKFTPKIFMIAEYVFHFYEFPELEPFERELAVSLNVSIP